MPPLLLIIDTNVWLSAIMAGARDTPPRRIFAAALRGHIKPVLSEDLIAEYARTVRREKIRRVHRLSDQQLTRLLADWITQAMVLTPPTTPIKAPDPHDQMLWDLLDTRADSRLVTGDAALLKEKAFPGRVLTPAECIAEL